MVVEVEAHYHHTDNLFWTKLFCSASEKGALLYPCSILKHIKPFGNICGKCYNKIKNRDALNPTKYESLFNSSLTRVSIRQKASLISSRDFPQVRSQFKWIHTGHCNRKPSTPAYSWTFHTEGCKQHPVSDTCVGGNTFRVTDDRKSMKPQIATLYNHDAQ